MLSQQPELAELNQCAANAPSSHQGGGGPKSNLNSSNQTAPTRADSIGTEKRAPVADSEAKKIELNGKLQQASSSSPCHLR